MKDNDTGWAWFERPSSRSDETLAANQANLDLARAFARCFREEDGRRILEHLHEITIRRALGPGATDALLRHVEGQRHLLAYVNALIARGRGGGAAK